MISGKEIGDILALYAKHGWILRRVLLSDKLRENLTENLFGNMEIVSSKLDALWFSRVSNKNEAWEIRHLSNTPFALVEVFPEGTSDKEREKVLSETQTRLINRTPK
ncbi:MAG TPA: hypothetical protein PKE69_13180 [Pyrinomonadaceae bacterium]|nr:hypothetical protein [Pyrinomonadaceae bacterium]